MNRQIARRGFRSTCLPRSPGRANPWMLCLLGLLAGVLMTLGWLRWQVEPGGSAEHSVVKQTEREVLYWVAPMDPNSRGDGPGKSPMGMDLVPVYAEVTSAQQKATEGDAVILSPGMEQSLGVRTEPAEVRPLWRRIEGSANVRVDENRIQHVHLRTPAWIEQLAVSTIGDRVREGQLLLRYYAPELVNAQREYLQAARRGDSGLVKGAAEKLRALGMDSRAVAALQQRGEAEQYVPLYASMDGVVTALGVREGMYVMPADEILAITDLSSVWAQADIYESQADWWAPGQAAEARLDYLPGEVFAGTVDYVYPILDPTTRTLRVRLRFDNSDERLKPNMYASVVIFGRAHHDALTVSRDAVIRGATLDRVVVALGGGRYRVQQVMTGIESGELVEIVAGLDAGQKVVTSAQFLIDSEASLQGSIRRLESPAEMTAESNVPRSVFGSGMVEALDLTGRRVTIDHGPIDELGWPSSRMDFEVAPEVPLERVREGQNVHFSLRLDGVGGYRIDTIHLVQPPGRADLDDLPPANDVEEAPQEPAEDEVPATMEHHHHG